MVEFAKNLADFVSSIGKKHVIILSSLDSGRMKKIVASRYMSFTFVVFFKKYFFMFSFLVPAFVRLDIGLPFSDMQVYYVSSTNNDGNDSDCERLGFKRLEEYDPTQRRWKYLNELAEGKTDHEDEPSFEDELVHDDYYPGLPFAALFSCCKVLLLVLH